jgi:hypothetical protein
MLASPYGVEVPVSPGNSDEFRFDLDATMTMLGIHAPEVRARCAAAARAAGIRSGAELLEFLSREEFGGRPPPRLPLLPVPRAESVYARLPVEMDVREVCDSWITCVADCHRWYDRAEALQELVAVNRHSWCSLPREAAGFGLSLMLTAVLENLGETEIDCLEAAAFYALATHDQWRLSAIAWLAPVRTTWWADWIKPRQGYRRLAANIRLVHGDAPPWVAGRKP